MTAPFSRLFLVSLLTFTSFYASAANCRLEVSYRVNSEEVQAKTEKIEDHLLKKGISPNLFDVQFYEEPANISKSLDTDTAYACYQAAIEMAKSEELAPQTKSIEIESLRNISDDRHIEVTLYPMIRWKAVDNWSAFPQLGSVTAFTEQCKPASADNFRGNRPFLSNCHKI